MDRTMSNYYTINRILLLSIGLWPYQKSYLRHIIIIFVTMLLLSGIIVQFMSLITMEYSMDLLLEILAYNIPWMGFTIKYNILCFNIKEMRHIIEQAQYVWKQLSDVQDTTIIKKYWAIGKFITLISTIFVYTAMLGFVLVQYSSNLVEIMPDANETRLRRLPIKAEYLIDQQKYFYPILLHLFLVAIFGITTVIATEALYMVYTQHACGLFHIVSSRIERALREDIMRDVAPAIERNLVACHGIISAVDIHRKAIEFIELAKANYRYAYMAALPLGVLSLSINLYRLSRLITTDNIHEMIVTALFISGHFWYIFFCNYLGQEVIDHSSHIFYKTYNTQWYTAPLKAQKLLLLIMQRSMRHCTIVLGGLFVPSLEGFATLTSMSVSYFMVIHSVS